MLEARGIVVTGTARAQHRLSVEQRGFLAQTPEPNPGELWGRPGSAVETGRQGWKYLAGHKSPLLGEDVVVTNKTSENLHAELLLRQLGHFAGEDGSAAQGARVVRAFLERAGVDKDDFVFFDGSGLSGHDLVTPRATARLLQYATMQPWFTEWRRSLPVGGEDGSLAERFAKSPLKDHVFAKTGTLGEARALSGYVDCASGRTVIFSIMVGNHTPRSNADRDVMDKIVAAIAAYN
jgi:D-alanyl-D-alanine carboxypeptidase/D-alanyl-D-alanine-endopeptidase (penicillin-binding protein 4)